MSLNEQLRFHFPKVYKKEYLTIEEIGEKLTELECIKIKVQWMEEKEKKRQMEKEKTYVMPTFPDHAMEFINDKIIISPRVKITRYTNYGHTFVGIDADKWNMDGAVAYCKKYITDKIIRQDGYYNPILLKLGEDKNENLNRLRQNSIYFAPTYANHRIRIKVDGDHITFKRLDGKAGDDGVEADLTEKLPSFVKIEEEA